MKDKHAVALGRKSWLARKGKYGDKIYSLMREIAIKGGRARAERLTKKES